jgi:glyoxylase-like metal-dependent hydrolase (beta-lactamase superfamily II)
MTTDSPAQPPSALTIEVYTSPTRTFVSSAAPQGPGDEPTWSPQSSTLIYGEHEAILIDTPATDVQVDALADWIESKGRSLSRIYITHGHGDHWLGLAKLVQRFPGAYGLATAEVLARAQFEATDPRLSAYWASIFPGEVPSGEQKVLPQLLEGDTIDLEGHELRIIRIGRADTADSTVLYVPSLAAVVTGDLVYNEVHMMTAEAGQTERDQWISNLDKVAALNPTIVVAGHKKVDRDNDPTIIAESQQYLRDFSEAVAEEDTAAAIVTRMAERYPNWVNVRTLWYSARAAASRTAS